MTIPTNTQLRASQQPRLPAAPVEYDQTFMDSAFSILRQYFNQVDNITQSILTNVGQRFFRAPSISVFDTTTQTAAANTVTLVTYNNVDFSNGIALDTTATNSKFTITYPGVYNVQFSAQGSNSGNAADNVTVWFRVNGVDVANAAGISAVPAKHGSINGALVFGWNQFLSLTTNDYVQIYWTTDAGTSSLTTYAASGTAPIHPASPSIAVTFLFVSAPLS
jgi:hypothetical protein